MGTDGLAVQKVWKNEAEQRVSDIAIAEFTSLLRNVKRINNDSNFGKLREMTISSEERIFILRLVNKDYFLAMVLDTNANFGRGRYEMQCAELLLSKDLSV